MSRDTSKIILFDVDGTLTAARKVIEPDMVEFLEKLKQRYTVGLVGGSDLPKITEQMDGVERINMFDFVFAENGLVALAKGENIATQSIQKFMGEDKMQELINFCLKYLSGVKLPLKRGTFIEFRNGMINICPIGRSCSYPERGEFSEFDKLHGVREKMVEALRNEFTKDGLVFSIGGQISIDAFPKGWDKTYCLNFLEKDFKEIYFFGDKTYKGGNDHEIFEDSRTKGYTVTSPEDTKKQVCQLFDIE
ncbi:phosphomannomutase [Strongylocentrotus purpuratus]|uniref:Phosphomannomutase n=1 Tax=Strongylocentrotus purpuratus TaxID=7668 RepID=A0A7M7PU49_STRPU|nr:phosphomannomutase-like [Strongylocentrotus purpuratus]XP_793484.1 phosphomannomutase [Strongylocentrotus purpuratus]|eukprot:XP_793484.1 PREDICTED: phosphomannomutase [Strongylocentrotus purpuratus]